MTSYSNFSNIVGGLNTNAPNNFTASITDWSDDPASPYSIPIVTANWTNVPGVQWVVLQFRETSWQYNNWWTWADISNTSPPPSTYTGGWVWNRGYMVSFRLYCSNGQYSNVSQIYIPGISDYNAPSAVSGVSASLSRYVGSVGFYPNVSWSGGIGAASFSINAVASPPPGASGVGTSGTRHSTNWEQDGGSDLYRYKGWTFTVTATNGHGSTVSSPYFLPAPN